MYENHLNVRGLSSEEVIASRTEYGRNSLQFKKENPVLRILKSLLTEPMVVLLLVTSTIYFVLGEYGDGLFLTAAILMVATISLFQDRRSRAALEKLSEISRPHCQVIRDGEVLEITIDEVVVGDSLMIEQGAPIAADGIIVQSNDFSADESMLTGESLPVYKDARAEDNMVYRGTTVTSGLAIVRVTTVGNATRLGQIGKSLDRVGETATPLEIQIDNFIRKMTATGILVFSLVWGINYFHSHNILDSLLKGLTLAMSILPEEIPVAFTTFMALGAWRLMKMGIVVKQMKTVETLGSATVICCDKTGTITRNEMALVRVYVMKTHSFEDPSLSLSTDAVALIRMAMWASEPIPFDPMEIALHQAYSRLSGTSDERPGYKMVHEYPLGGTPPMMTHLFENSHKNRIIAAKGAPEAFYTNSGLRPEELVKLKDALTELAGEGYRVLGVGEARFEGNDFPEKQQDFYFRFLGLVAFYDPPKENISTVFQKFLDAGIAIKIITGDNGVTTGAIAKQINFPGSDRVIEGSTLMAMGDEAFQKTVQEGTVFTRMFPEAKLKVIEALKENGEIVAMTGDGINDGPALKAAHIGVAMGRKGTEIAKDAASLILLEDDLSKMVDAIAMGRKIYANLKKAIQYVISIHIPIILVVFTPLALGWIYPNIFSPLHVILLELIMGPTCSIIYENEPMEMQTMIQKPRPFTDTFFNWKELLTSITQGLMITIGALLIYQYCVRNGYDEQTTRTMVFSVLLIANIFLTLVNRSFYYSILATFKYRNFLVPLIISITVVVTLLLIYVRPLAQFFEFRKLSGFQLGLCVLTSFLFVLWYEVVKLRKRLSSAKKRVS
jgi:Ca2+-transporting ATPase